MELMALFSGSCVNSEPVASPVAAGTIVVTEFSVPVELKGKNHRLGKHYTCEFAEDLEREK